ncbi:hypothetical protein [Roseibium sp. M-1]
MSTFRFFVGGIFVGIFLWLVFIVFIVFLQINGLILNDVIQIDFGEYVGWDPLIAFGTVVSAFAATLAAVIALIIDSNSRNEREIQSKAAAQAKRATAAIALSEMCLYFSRCAQEYEKFFRYLENDRGDAGYVHLNLISLTESEFSSVEIPYKAIRVLEKTLERFPDHLKDVAESISVVQVTNARMNGLARDVKIVNAGTGFNLFTQILELAEAYNKISDLFDWARFRSKENQNQTAGVSFHGLRLQIANEQKLVEWINNLD